MDPREFELIAISHVLARYRATGVLPNINGEPFDLAKFKAHLSAGIDTDVDVAIIKNTIVNEDDDQCQHDGTKPSAIAEPEQPKPERTEPEPEPVASTGQEEPEQAPTEQKEEPTQEKSSSTLGGKLFQFFNKDN